ncbi:MAG: hypothetical protein EPO40_16150 [Myxococcaceae bacterium]|nr:MAG: hypothetical protein EPO40_16150 [Myxococcaceae bacterium]
MNPFDDFGTSDLLLDRLASQPDQLAFLVGSAINAPLAHGGPGVPGVTEIVQLVREAVADRPGSQRLFDEAMERDPSRPYQAAFNFLQKVRGQPAVNSCVRRAVVRARRVPVDPRVVSDEAKCRQLEEDYQGWSLTPGTEALGRILAARTTTDAPIVLTPNFDPLIKVSVKRAGGQAHSTALDVDGNSESTDASGTHVVHIHGHWCRSDTLHTFFQLSRPRPELEGTLGRLLQRQTLVVLAYSGWEDSFTRSLVAAVQSNARFDVLWAFYGDDPARIAKENADLLASLEKGRIRGRIVPYYGVDVHKFLPRLAAELGIAGGGAKESRSTESRTPSEAEHIYAVRNLSAPERRPSLSLHWSVGTDRDTTEVLVVPSAPAVDTKEWLSRARKCFFTKEETTELQASWDAVSLALASAPRTAVLGKPPQSWDEVLEKIASHNERLANRIQKIECEPSLLAISKQVLPPRLEVRLEVENSGTSRASDVAVFVESTDVVRFFSPNTIGGLFFPDQARPEGLELLLQLARLDEEARIEVLVTQPGERLGYSSYIPSLGRHSVVVSENRRIFSVERGRVMGGIPEGVPHKRMLLLYGDDVYLAHALRDGEEASVPYKCLCDELAEPDSGVLRILARRI